MKSKILKLRPFRSYEAEVVVHLAVLQLYIVAGVAPVKPAHFVEFSVLEELPCEAPAPPVPAITPADKK